MSPFTLYVYSSVTDPLLLPGTSVVLLYGRQWSTDSNQVLLLLMAYTKGPHISAYGASTLRTQLGLASLPDYCCCGLNAQRRIVVVGSLSQTNVEEIYFVLLSVVLGTVSSCP